MAVIKADICTKDQNFRDTAYKFAEEMDVIVTSISDDEVCGLSCRDLRYHVFTKDFVMKNMAGA